MLPCRSYKTTTTATTTKLTASQTRINDEISSNTTRNCLSTGCQPVEVNKHKYRHKSKIQKLIVHRSIFKSIH